MKVRTKIRIALLFIAFTAAMSAAPVKAQLFLTKEEQEYINNRDAIKAVSVDGVAPIQYYDSKGRVKGISNKSSGYHIRFNRTEIHISAVQNR